MTDEERRERYEQAMSYMLEKKVELGRMPRERDLKKDSMVNTAQLVKDLGKKSFSEAVIEVLRHIRAQDGRPESLLQRKRQEPVVEKEVVEMTEEKTSVTEVKTGRPNYTYEDVWQFAKERGLATLSGREFTKLHNQVGGPAANTVRRFLGNDKSWWAEQLACETAEEGLKVKERLELGRQKVAEPASPPKCLEEEAPPQAGAITREELLGMLEAIGAMSQYCRNLEARWEATVYAGKIPVEVTLHAKTPK